MNMRNIIAKMLLYASENFNPMDIETLVGVNTDTVKALASEVSEGKDTVGTMLENFKGNEKFGILMGVKSCYSAFLTRAKTIQILGLTNEECDELDRLLQW